MLNAIQGGKLYAHCYTLIEALCSMLYKERSYMLIVILGVKLYAHTYTWIEASCSLFYMN